MVIPLKTIQKVLENYFTTPLSLDRIAGICGISKTSVFNIVTAKKGEDPSFALMRYLVENLDKNGTDVVHYGQAIRISKLLDEHGIDQETGERIMEEFLVACSQEHWPVADAVDTLIRYKLVAKEYAMTPMGFCIERNQWIEVLKSLQERKNKVQEGLNKLIKVDKMVRDNFDYFASNPFQLSWLMAREAEQYKTKYEELLKDIQVSRNEKSIDSTELENLNKKLIRPVTQAQLLEKLEDIRQNPAKYWHIFEDDIWTPPTPELGVT
jgi:hypothetical protein